MIKNPTGDSMSKAPNLVDLLANRNEALPKAGQPVDARKSESGAKPSFQARVKESRAKLASGSHKFFPQGNAPESRRNEAAAAAKSDARSKADASAISKAAQRADLDRPGGSVDVRKQSGGDGDSSGSRTEKGNGNGGMDPGRRSAGRIRSASKDMAEASSANEDSASVNEIPAAPSEATASRKEAVVEELRNGMESLGISVTREQLDDPVFLADMLEMLQNMGAPLAIAVAAGTPAMPEGMEADSADGMPHSSAHGFQSTQTEPEIPNPATRPVTSGIQVAAQPMPAENAEAAVETPAENTAESGDGSMSRKEAAALIRDRIAELTRNSPDEGGGGSQRTTNVPSTTPGAWQGVVVRPHGESLGADPLPMADLDRLRVLQASALQASASAKENTPALSLESDAESPDEAEGGKISYLPAAEDSDATEGEPDPGQYGRKEDGFKNPDLVARRETSAIPKDGAATPQFLNALDQARSPDHRAAVQRAWVPHQPAFEKNVLDQISRKMSGIGIKSGEELSIQLAPENLGKVRISLELKDGIMSARIGVENESVRQIVELNLAGLRDSLETQGIKLQGLEVSVDQRHGSLFNPDGSNAESFFRRKGRGEGDGPEGRETAPFESAPESDTGRRLGYNTLEYIG